ncbi:His Kinase A (phospho-acceptor) domain-containing protein [Lachnospiraceae bacterium C10]|nr:His Kinase A (phospho-acceptor) domain-containing protein [Lachnospiraceae bacterium C10]
MFSRSRKKIILSIMLSLILLFGVTLSVIMLASYHEIRQQSSEMLERYVEMYSLDQQSEPEKAPDVKPDNQELPGSDPKQGDLPPDLGPGFQLSTFYSVAFSEDGTVLSVNDGAKELYSEDELISIARELLAKNKTAGRLDNLSYQISSKTGYTLVAFIDDTVRESSMQALLHNVLIIGGASIVILFFISLVLSRRIIRPLEENDKQQKQFISDASHELKTPVAVISTNAELLSREIGENEWLANIQYENERMGDLVKQLLNLSRAENTETPMETVDLSRIVTGEVLAFESVAFDQGKTIQSDIDDNIHVTGNQAQLTQLTSILMDNAVRHGTGSEIELLLKRQGHTAVLSAVNDGDEIPPEKLEHLFDRFYRVDEARNSDGHHYGLGLSIAKAVAEKHGGSIAVSSQDGKVRFTVSIPEKNK